MKNKIFISLILLCSIIVQAGGQDGSRNSIFVETGFDAIGGIAPEKDYIRTLGSSFYTFPLYAERVQAMMLIPYLGVRFERMMAGNLLGLSGGLRYSMMFSSIGRESYLSGTDRFFYVNYNEDGSDTEYARVRELSQRTGYVGVPVELRITPGKDRVVKMFYKIGLSLNFKIHSVSDVVFFDDSMDPYSGEVVGVIEKASPFYSAFYIGGGLKIGRNDKPSVILGFNAPTAICMPGSDKFVRPVAGAGLNMMVRIPVNKY